MIKWPESNMARRISAKPKREYTKTPILNLFRVYRIDHSFDSKVYNGIPHTRVTWMPIFQGWWSSEDPQMCMRVGGGHGGDVEALQLTRNPLRAEFRWHLPWLCAADRHWAVGICRRLSEVGMSDVCLTAGRCRRSLSSRSPESTTATRLG
jgi:hypothetical protein